MENSFFLNIITRGNSILKDQKRSPLKIKSKEIRIVAFLFGLILCFTAFYSVAQNSFEHKTFPFLNQNMDMGTGLCTCDFDGDLDEDILAGSTNHLSRFFENRGGEIVQLNNENEYQGKGSFNLHGIDFNVIEVTSANCADIDNDGDKDLLITSYTTFPSLLIYENLGDFKFKQHEVSDKFSDDEFFSTSQVIFIDANFDGLIDLYVLNYIQEVDFIKDENGELIEHKISGGPDALFLNDGNFIFRDASESYGIGNSGNGLGAMTSDINGDHIHDILLLNDFGKNSVPNQALIWDVEKNKFNDNLKNEFKIWMFGMGVASGDLNHDGVLDYYMTNIGNNEALFSDEVIFRNHTEKYGLLNGKFGDSLLVSWGVNFIDVENDGMEELFVSHGNLITINPLYNKIYQRNSIFQFDESTKKYEDVGEQLGFINGESTRATIHFDYNFDGNLDLMESNISWLERTDFINNKNIPDKQLVLHTNTSINDNNYLSIRIKAEKADMVNNDAYGSTVMLYSNGTKMVRDHSGGGSYHAKNSDFLHFGVGGKRMIDSLLVYYPGTTEPKKLYHLETNQHYIFEIGDESLSIIDKENKDALKLKEAVYQKEWKQELAVTSLNHIGKRSSTLVDQIQIKQEYGGYTVQNISGQHIEKLQVYGLMGNVFYEGSLGTSEKINFGNIRNNRESFFIVRVSSQGQVEMKKVVLISNFE